MTITVTPLIDNTTLTVTVEGKLSAATAPELEKCLKKNLNGITGLILDFKGVTYLASAGLRVILSAARVMLKQGTMKITNVMPEVMEVFTFTGMADELNIETME